MNKRVVHLYLLILGIFAAYSNCSPTNGQYGYSSQGSAPALALWPIQIDVSPNSTTPFTAYGGSPPYSYFRMQGSGTINQMSGTYTAPASAGTDIIGVYDTSNQVAYATVRIVTSSNGSTLTISPSTINLIGGSNYTFTASGGASPYNFFMQSGNGSINQTTGVYTAPASAGTDVVKVVDSQNGMAMATITIGASGGTALTISPSTTSVAPGGTTTFSGSGGTAPYTFYVYSGAGVINQSTGVYTAPNASEIDEVEVVDSAYHVAYAIVTVTSSATGSQNLSEIYRFVNTAITDHLYSTSSTEGLSAGYTSEGAVFKLYADSSVPGTVPLYRCRTSTIPQRHFLSNFSNCEGLIVEATLGYMNPVPVSGSYSLYRFISPSGSDHFETINYADGANAGYIYQGTLGFVFSP